MAKRRNAGKGFGMMFHGAFGTKEAAKRKERQVGGFIQPRTIKGEKRFVVMSERKNPRRRNAGKMQVVFDPGIQQYSASKYVAKYGGNVYASGYTKKEAAKNLRDRLRAYRRGEPVESHRGYGHNPEMYYAATDASGRRVMDWRTDKDYARRQAKTYGGKLLAWDGRSRPGTERVVKDYAGSRYRPVSIENPSELVVMGANPGPPEEIVLQPHREYLIRTNPSAEAIREDFTGTPAEGYTVYDVDGMPAGDYAQLGTVLVLYVKPVIGGQVREIQFKDPPILLSDTTRRQLYFLHGDQDVSKDIELFTDKIPADGIVKLGEVRQIDYKGRKEHHPNPELDEWAHKFGEDTGVRPALWFDQLYRRLYLRGGEYEVRGKWLVN